MKFGNWKIPCDSNRNKKCKICSSETNQVEDMKQLIIAILVRTNQE